MIVIKGSYAPQISFQGIPFEHACITLYHAHYVPQARGPPRFLGLDLHDACQLIGIECLQALKFDLLYLDLFSLVDIKDHVCRLAGNRLDGHSYSSAGITLVSVECLYLLCTFLQGLFLYD